MSRKLNFEDDFTHYMEHFDPVGDWELYPTDRDELLAAIRDGITTMISDEPDDRDDEDNARYLSKSYISNVADGIEYERKQRQLRKGE